MAVAAARSKPVLHSEYCKACGRCLEACIRDCLTSGAEIHPASGFVPIALSLDQCNGCGLCIDACPEPYGLVAAGSAEASAPRPRRPPVPRLPLQRTSSPPPSPSRRGRRS